MKIFKLPVMVMIALLTFSCSQEEVTQHTNDSIFLTNAPSPKLIEIEIIERINEYRISIGLNSLETLNVIKSVALTQTDYMIGINNINHDNFEIRRSSLIKNANATAVSENVAYGFTTAEGVVNAWLKSSSHRAVIEGNSTQFDISAEQNSRDIWFCTNIFIKK
ncbi:MAG: CAP domain-containing protein [Aquaticitalea sp.]